MTAKKTIGILTLHRSDNYGAMYQAYALSTLLRQQGHAPFIVNYHMEAASLRSYLRRPFAFLGKVAGKRAISYKFLTAKRAEQSGKRRQSQFATIFEDFRKQHLQITETVYDYETLKANCPEADAFIVGSDQVWAADFVFSSPAFLLGFVPDHVKRISYAASFGKANLEFYLQSTFKKFISRFDAVSVREKSGVDLVRKIAGFEPTHVVDPTLLLTDYSEIIDYSLVPDGDYILTYRLGQDAGLTHWMNESLDAISSAMELPIVVVSTNTAETVSMIGENLHPTPGQLLGLIEKSAFFATNSFHGTVFALLLKADFLTFARDSAPDKQNLRLTELLETVGLDSCYCPPNLEPSKALEKTGVFHDYDQAYKALSLLRADSLAFLDRALQ